MPDEKNYPNYINGEWVCGEAAFENRNPADTRDLVGTFVKGSPSDAAAAAESAQAAFPAWASMTPPARGAYLFKIADWLESRLDELAEQMTREEGKTLPEARGETLRSIHIFRYFAGEGARMPGMLVPSERERVFMYSLRKPLGVVGLVTPWNFPSAIPAWKMAPALIAGNTVVLKPASAAPLSAWRLAEACHAVGVPPGVVNFVAGPGAELGEALVNAEPLKAVSFTGSCETGNWLHARASRRRLRIQLEMGGKNPTIVLDDADLNSAVGNTVQAAFASTGQKCTATSRVIVEDGVHDAFVDALIERTKALTVGNGLQPGVDVGPAIDQAQLDTNMRYVEIASRDGAKLEFGGRRLTGADYDHGYFFEPTVYTGVERNMRIAREEVFGPLLAVMRARDFEHAIELANSVAFGLSASIQTANASRVFEYVEKIEAGLLTVNLPSAGVEYQLPFGGTKDSSFGPKEQGPAALDFYTDYKTVYWKY